MSLGCSRKLKALQLHLLEYEYEISNRQGAKRQGACDLYRLELHFFNPGLGDDDIILLPVRQKLGPELTKRGGLFQLWKSNAEVLEMPTNH